MSTIIIVYKVKPALTGEFVENRIKESLAYYFTPFYLIALPNSSESHKLHEL